MSISAVEEESFQKHKLCGYLYVVLSVESSSHRKEEITKSLAFNTRCKIFGDGIDSIEFRTEDGITLLPIPNSNSENQDVTTSLGDNKKVLERGSGSSSGKKKKKKRQRLGLVGRSKSVVHQLYVLTMHKCLEIVSRVVKVSVREVGNDARVVLLIDVYLPLSLLSRGHFPKSGSIAASLFSHMSCDWEQRNLVLVDESYFCREDDDPLWRHSDCHVFGCKIHHSLLGSFQKKRFELHEIFKSLPGALKEEMIYSTRINATDSSLGSGIWDLSDDLLMNILTALEPRDLISIAITCRHLRSLTSSVIPCMKLKLFPHQQAAVDWMLQRELNPETLVHPLYMDFLTADGLKFYVNAVSGEIATGIAPTVRDFRGGLFCDEPGLGKTITALSLILKTQGVLADPPNGVEVQWCSHNDDQRCGYYELSGDKCAPGNVMPSWKRSVCQNGRRGQLYQDILTLDEHTKSCSPKNVRLSNCNELPKSIADTCPANLGISSCTPNTVPAKRLRRSTGSLGHVRKNLFGSCEEASDGRMSNSGKKRKKDDSGDYEHDETWVQCDACRKWRKLQETSLQDSTAAWFCSMNSDLFYRNCDAPEESFDYKQPILYLPGFCSKGTSGGMEENVSFFMGVLKDHSMFLNSETRKALTWLAKLSHDKLLEMGKIGLTRPVIDTRVTTDGNAKRYYKIFQSFGLVRKIERGISRWYYPRNIDNLVFDVAALQISLTKPLDFFRLYLSRATLIVVPANLVDHWKTQIMKHVRPRHLHVCIWTDQKKPLAHNLAWDYDVVITTFSRLSAEWGPRKKSVLTQVHWRRVILDEGHTLGSSLGLTNKLQMAISLTASSRWILTGTPMPNTPDSQVSHLQPMLKFLHEEAYGQNQKSWEAGVLRPFEAKIEEGRSRLLDLLNRCMISARKLDLHTIPPCIKKVVFLNFMEEHARSYNELVVTIRRNILMADWNDPSHVESLLNPKQWKFRSRTIRNVRLSCCVAGHIKVTEAGDDIRETMDVLVSQGLDPASEEYAFIRHSILDGCSCYRCKEWCRLPVITPCRHLLCLDCVALDSEKCTFPGCGNSYKMQSPEIRTRSENPNPKWPVPQDLIELQPSYEQDDWNPDWHATSSSKVAYLVKRLKALQESNIKIGYSVVQNKESTSDELLNSNKQLGKALLHPDTCSNPSDSALRIPSEKVIIFSQFLEHIHVIEQQLTGAGIKVSGLYSPMHSTNKMKSLAIFQHDASCMVLLMDGSAALGLDLSFVTHVFLMEPIWDGSMEEQVISRAHRMGATRPINVEILAMRGTIEEQMLKFLKDVDGSRGSLQEEFMDDLEGGRRRTLHDFAESNYLSQLSFVKTTA